MRIRSTSSARKGSAAFDRLAQLFAFSPANAALPENARKILSEEKHSKYDRNQHN
jgi:hypothetical protein